jgi:hypothetical protein
LKVAEKREEKAMAVCPLCSSKMEKGYVASKMISWSAKKISNWSLTGLFSGELIVSRGYPYLIANLEAYRCRKCKLVIFRYGEANPAEASP